MTQIKLDVESTINKQFELQHNDIKISNEELEQSKILLSNSLKEVSLAVENSKAEIDSIRLANNQSILTKNEEIESMQKQLETKSAELIEIENLH